MKSLQTVSHAHYNKRGIFVEKITGFFYLVSGAFTKLATTIVGGHFLEKVKRQKQNQYWVEADYNALKVQHRHNMYTRQQSDCKNDL